MKYVDGWKEWGMRLRAHLREKDRNLAWLALETNLAESTLRSWTNGTREINLSDFFMLCQTAKLDPATILFGHPLMTPEHKRQIGQLAATIIEADPSAAPHYGKLIKSIKKQRPGDQLRKPLRAKTKAR